MELQQRIVCSDVITAKQSNFCAVSATAATIISNVLTKSIIQRIGAPEQRRADNADQRIKKRIPRGLKSARDDK